MMRSAAVVTSFLMVCSAAAWAQVDAPLLGYLPDGGHIRPVYGIPAAAAIAPALDFGRDFALIAVSQTQDFAIATDAATGAVLLAKAGGGTSPISGVSPKPDRIVLSPRGSAAALWFASTSHVQIVSGLPGSPSVRELDATFLTSYLNDPSLIEAPASLAISDDGQWLAGSWSQGVFAFGPHGEVNRLPLRERAAALAFFAGRHDLAIATHLHIFSIADVGGRATESRLFAGDKLSPAGMALSADNQQLVLAETSGSLLALDLNTNTASRFDCGCAPEGVFGMGRSRFRLTGLTGGVFRLFDASTGDVFFVPLAGGQGEQQ